MRTAEEVRAQQAGYNTSQEVSNLVPSYIEGFKHVLDKYYRVTVKAGVTTVQGSKVTLTEDVFLRDVDWLTVKTTDSGSFFYVYLTRTKQLKVDRTPPTYSGKYFCFAHPVFSYRAIGKLWANASGDILWCTSYFTNYTNQITTAQTGYLGYADYYISTEEDASILFQAANDYLYGAFTGGVNTILRGAYTTENKVTLDYGIGFRGEGEQTLIKINTVGDNGFEFRGAASFGVGIVNCKIQNIETTAQDKYLINFNGAARSKVESCILDYVKCAGILNDGSNNTINANQMSGGRSSTITRNSATELFSGLANGPYIYCDDLSDTTFITCYKKSADAKLYAKIGSTVNSVTTYGSESEIFNDNNNTRFILKLSSTKVVCIYSKASNGNLYAKVLTYTDTVISAIGAEQTIKTGITSSLLSATRLTDTTFVVVFSNAGISCISILCTESDSSLSLGAEETIYTGEAYTLTISAFNATTIIATYSYLSGTYLVYGRIGSVSGTSISYGIATFITTSAWVTWCDAIDDTHAIMAYADETNSGYGTALILKKTGTVFALGSSSVFASADCSTAGINTITVTKLDSTHYAIIYYNGGDAKFYYCIGSMFDYNLMISASAVLHATGGKGSWACPLMGGVQTVVIQDSASDYIYGYFLSADSGRSISIESSGNNAIISSNHITADDTEVQEVGIYVSGDESIVVNNQIDGLYSAARNIKLGILVTSDSVRSQVASNSVKNCLNYGYVEYGKNTMYAQNLAFNNGSDTGIGNANQNNWLAAGTGTQQGTNSWQSPVDAEPSVGTLHLLVNPTIWNVLNAGTATTFTDINLSSLIPLGSKAVLLGCQINATTTSTVTPYAMLICRQNGTTVDNGNASRLGQYRDPGPIGVTYSDNGQLIVGCDNNRIIEYRLANTNSIAAAYITLLGYYL